MHGAVGARQGFSVDNQDKGDGFLHCRPSQQGVDRTEHVCTAMANVMFMVLLRSRKSYRQQFETTLSSV